MDHRLQKLGQYLRGWTAYFGISRYYRPVPELIEQDQTAIAHVLLETVALAALRKIRHLLDLGVSLKTAIQHGVSSKR